MRKISLLTAHHVVIDFPLATLGQRMAAFALDFMVSGMMALLLAAVTSPLGQSAMYFALAAFILYPLMSEMTMSGQTLGKKAMKIRVVRVDGTEPQAFDYVIRWAFVFVDVYLSAGSLAVIFISTGPRGQRLGDLLSHTMVVSQRGELDLNLSDILRISDLSNHQPKYTEAYRFSEADMLTVKSLLERHSKYLNPAHSTLLLETAGKCAEVLKLPAAPADSRKFLTELMKDYIVITRS